jgi:hypothetical protein
MNATQRKKLLHLRIEQANEEMQIVLAEVVEVLFQTYQPEVMETEAFVAKNEGESEKVAAYEATLEPMSKADFYEQINHGIEEYKRGESIPLEDAQDHDDTAFLNN